MKDINKAVADRMKEYQINYAKGKMRRKPVYPYFVGQLYLTDSGDESGGQEYEMLLDGFDRSPDEEAMLSAVEKLEEAFPAIGGHIVRTKKNVTMICFDSLIPDIPTDTDADLNRNQIKLRIKKWRC